MKTNVKKLLANNGVELAGYVAMMRCINCGLLKKNGNHLSKDSILPDHRPMMKKFKKEHKDIQRWVRTQASISTPEHLRHKCPPGGHFIHP